MLIVIFIHLILGIQTEWVPFLMKMDGPIPLMGKELGQ